MTPVSFRILVTDDIDPDGVALLSAEPSFIVDVVPTLPPAELLERIGDYDAFVGRSATRITEPLLKRAGRLRVVGRAGVGVDNIAIDAATALGIAVINAPAGNTVAVAELFFGTVIGLLRHLPRAATSMHAGKWDRSQLLGTELTGKTLASWLTRSRRMPPIWPRATQARRFATMRCRKHVLNSVGTTSSTSVSIRSRPRNSTTKPCRRKAPNLLTSARCAARISAR